MTILWDHSPPSVRPLLKPFPAKNLSSRPERSVVEGPAVSFCSSALTAPNKSHQSPLCHPERSQATCGAPRLPHKGLSFVSSHTDPEGLGINPEHDRRVV